MRARCRARPWRRGKPGTEYGARSGTEPGARSAAQLLLDAARSVPRTARPGPVPLRILSPPPQPPVLHPARSGTGHPRLGRAVGARCHPAPPLPWIRAGLFRRSGAGVRLAGGGEDPAWIPRAEGNRRCEAGAGAELRPPARPGRTAAPSPAPGQPRPRGIVPVWALLRPCSVWGRHAAPAGHRSGPVTPPPRARAGGEHPNAQTSAPLDSLPGPLYTRAGHTQRGQSPPRPGPESHPVPPAAQQPQCWLPGGAPKLELPPYAPLAWAPPGLTLFMGRGCCRGSPSPGCPPARRAVGYTGQSRGGGGGGVGVPRLSPGPCGPPPCQAQGQGALACPDPPPILLPPLRPCNAVPRRQDGGRVAPPYLPSRVWVSPGCHRPQNGPFPAQAGGGNRIATGGLAPAPGRGHSWAAWGLSHPRPPWPRTHAETGHSHTRRAAKHAGAHAMWPRVWVRAHAATCVCRSMQRGHGPAHGNTRSDACGDS